MGSCGAYPREDMAEAGDILDKMVVHSRSHSQSQGEELYDHKAHNAPLLLTG